MSILFDDDRRLEEIKRKIRSGYYLNVVGKKLGNLSASMRSVEFLAKQWEVFARKSAEYYQVEWKTEITLVVTSGQAEFLRLYVTDIAPWMIGDTHLGKHQFGPLNWFLGERLKQYSVLEESEVNLKVKDYYDLLPDVLDYKLNLDDVAFLGKAV